MIVSSLIILIISFGAYSRPLCFLPLFSCEGEHAVVEVDGIDAGAAGDGCVWDFGGAEALCVHKVQTAGEDSVLAVTFMPIMISRDNPVRAQETDQVEM